MKCRTQHFRVKTSITTDYKFHFRVEPVKMSKMDRSSIVLVGIIVAIIVLLSYPLKKNAVRLTDNDETSVSLCQIHVRSDQASSLDEQTLLSLLATLKMHDFQIGQPVWGPSDTRLYLCEHPLKAGLKQSIIDDELKNIIKNSGESSKRFAWSCA